MTALELARQLRTIQEFEDVAEICTEAAGELERLAQLTDALERIAEQQPDVLRMFEESGIVFATPFTKTVAERTDAERWEGLAFTVYSRLCEVDCIARAALGIEVGEVVSR